MIISQPGLQTGFVPAIENIIIFLSIFLTAIHFYFHSKKDTVYGQKMVLGTLIHSQKRNL